MQYRCITCSASVNAVSYRCITCNASVNAVSNWPLDGEPCKRQRGIALLEQHLASVNAVLHFWNNTLQASTQYHLPLYHLQCKRQRGIALLEQNLASVNAVSYRAITCSASVNAVSSWPQEGVKLQLQQKF